MKWHWFFLTIAATTAITLPIPALSEDCNVETWNQTLKYQRKVDHWYNEQATKFNVFLKKHRHQVFLHQEFNTQELEMFWRPQKRNLHKIISQQIDASREVIRVLDYQSDRISEESRRVKSAQQRWYRISKQCEKDNQLANAATSLGYVKSNKALKADVSQLLSKMEQIKAIYQREVDILTWTKDEDEH